jgi:pyruvate-formate lyase
MGTHLADVIRTSLDRDLFARQSSPEEFMEACYELRAIAFSVKEMKADEMVPPEFYGA